MRILLLTPSTFGYETRLREAFERLGHDVEWIDERVGNDVVSKVLTRLGLLRAIPTIIGKHLDRIIGRAKSIDAERVIIVNPETLRGKDFAQIKAGVPNAPLVIYRWDSLAQKPIDDEAFAAANAVYSFDPEDCDNDARLRHLPLFHGHAEKPEARADCPKDYDVSFVGTAQLRRIQMLGRLCRQLKSSERPYLFYLKTQSPIHYAIFWVAAKIFGYNGVLSKNAMPYDRLLQVIDQSAAVVDIEFHRQSGLTMRTFEVVFSGMPLLTTNANIRRYEFFADAPIFVFDESSSDLPDFSSLKGSGIEPYFDKYSIDHWAKTLAEIECDSYYADNYAGFGIKQLESKEF